MRGFNLHLLQLRRDVADILFLFRWSWRLLTALNCLRGSISRYLLKEDHSRFVCSTVTKNKLPHGLQLPINIMEHLVTLWVIKWISFLILRPPSEVKYSHEVCLPSITEVFFLLTPKIPFALFMNYIIVCSLSS